MRAASILFLALLATTAHADPRNKYLPNTDILLVDYGYMKAFNGEELGTAKVAIADPAPPHHLVFFNITTHCKDATMKVHEFNWAPTSEYPRMQPVYDFLCKRTWLKRMTD